MGTWFFEVVLVTVGLRNKFDPSRCQRHVTYGQYHPHHATRAHSALWPHNLHRVS